MIPTSAPEREIAKLTEPEREIAKLTERVHRHDLRAFVIADLMQRKDLIQRIQLLNEKQQFNIICLTFIVARLKNYIQIQS